MRRKFLYFKIFDHNENPVEVEILSSTEITNLVGEVTPIDNIFQLTQQPEVKRIIEKDLALQDALTDSLPRRGRHGYLWVGTDLPDVVLALTRLSYIKEVFLFQQLLDSEPAFVKEKFKNKPFQEFDIYLWRVLRFWTFSYYLNRTLFIGSISKNETEIDENFKSFREELDVRPDKPLFKEPSQMITYNQDSVKYDFNLDQRYFQDSNPDTRWIRAIVNAVMPKEEIDTLYIPFTGRGEFVMEASLSGIPVYGEDLNPLHTVISSANGAFFNLDCKEFARLINEMQSKIKMLMSANAATQTDLFLYSVEGQFLTFWQDERKRLKTLQLNNIDETTLKYFAATRFLIQTQTVAKTEIYNNIFSTVLINTITQAIRKKDSFSFLDVYKRNLHEVYIKLYVFNKALFYYKPAFAMAEIRCKNVLDGKVPSKVSSIIADLPGRLGRNGFERDRIPIAVVHLAGAEEDIEKKLFGNKTSEPGLEEEAQIELDNKTGFYKKLPREALDWFNRMELMGRKDDIIRLFILWKCYYQALQGFSETLDSSGRLCLLLSNPYLKVENETYLLPSNQVLQKIIEEDETLKLKTDHSFTKTVLTSRNQNKKDYHILLCSKA